MGLSVRFVIPGRPITKKNSRRIFGNRLVASEAAMRWADGAVFELRGQMVGLGRRPLYTTEVAVRALVYRVDTQGDLINYLQAIADAMQKAEVLRNDKQIVSWDGSRALVDRDNPRTEIYVETY